MAVTQSLTTSPPEFRRADWVKTVLFDRGYLSRIRGEAIKVYLVIIEASGGLPDRSVTLSLSQLMERTRLSCPTVIASLGRLERLGLVVSTMGRRGKVKTYYVANPTAAGAEPEKAKPSASGASSKPKSQPQTPPAVPEGCR